VAVARRNWNPLVARPDTSEPALNAIDSVVEVEYRARRGAGQPTASTDPPRGRWCRADADQVVGGDGGGGRIWL